MPGPVTGCKCTYTYDGTNWNSSGCSTDGYQEDTANAPTGSATTGATQEVPCIQKTGGGGGDATGVDAGNLAEQPNEALQHQALATLDVLVGRAKQGDDEAADVLRSVQAMLNSVLS